MRPHAAALAALVVVLGAVGCARSRTEDRPRDGGSAPDAPLPHDGGVDAGPPTTCDDDEACDDGLFCTGEEYCHRGTRTCRSSRVPDCARTLCFGAVCDPALDACAPPDQDDDGDPVIGCGGGGDCDDTDPAVASGYTEVGPACANGKDEDCDGLRDCVDPSCATSALCASCDTTPIELDCFDGLDEDCDGRFDSEDLDCCVPRPDGREICMNGFDGDCDGKQLCEDEDCQDLPDCAG